MKKLILLASLLILTSACLKAQSDYYWVGGSGNWNDVSHWATSSGGSTFATVVPSNTTHVHFDANS